MQIKRLNPVQLHETPGYHHITVVEAGRTAYLAGQCPLDVDGNVVGEGDLHAQIEAVAANTLTALSAVDAQPGDVVRAVIYVATDDEQVLGDAWKRLNESSIAEAFKSACVLLGVTKLGFRGQLIEVEVTAALTG
jgi:enamine deaminase RidA (YjgF/YER057c/UK114 family)